MHSQPLSKIPTGETVRLVSIDGNRKLVKRLLSLGITLGVEVEILHHRGQGVVVGRNGNRVALGKGIVEKLQAEKID
ncbi:MAG: ferrous iron transport protein A [Gammaproteobacteria bacterium]|nr:ferrous iron transport protein A [Gammaproteobacteria bacterium]